MKYAEIIIPSALGSYILRPLGFSPFDFTGWTEMGKVAITIASFALGVAVTSFQFRNR